MSIYVGNIRVDPSGVKKVYYGPVLVYEKERYMYVENTDSIDGNLTISTGGAWELEELPSLKYSFNRTDWNDVDLSSSNFTITIPSLSKVYLKNAKNTLSLNYNKYIKIKADCNHDVGGNILSLIKWSNCYDYCFCSLFKDDDNLLTKKGLVNASKLILPSILSRGCFRQMFNGCSCLTAAPALPATTLAEKCYIAMFEWCNSLTVAPSLPATTLAKDCYTEMFSYCKSLTVPPTLPATTLAESCYSGMFSNCDNLTTLPNLPATILPDRCYEFMFNNCISLKIYLSSGDGHRKQWIIPTNDVLTRQGTDCWLQTFNGVVDQDIGDFEQFGINENTQQVFYTQNDPV